MTDCEEWEWQFIESPYLNEDNSAFGENIWLFGCKLRGFIRNPLAIVHMRHNEWKSVIIGKNLIEFFETLTEAITWCEQKLNV